MKAPRSWSASTTSTRSGSPKTRSDDARNDCTALRTASRCSRLTSAPMRTCSERGSPTVTFARRSASAPTTVSTIGLGTSTRRMAVHFWPALTVISVTTPLTKSSSSASDRGDVGAEDRAVQRVGLDAELDAAVEHLRVVAEQAGGVGRPGEAHLVVHGELVEQPVGAAGEQLQGALGQQSRLDDAPDDELGQVGRLRGRLDDAGHPGDERRRQLLEHPPDREVERVDLDRHAGARGVDVPPDEVTAATQLLDGSVEEDDVVGQLARAPRRDRHHRADAAVDVDGAVAGGRAGPVRQVVELVLEPQQVLAESLQQAGALVEGQGRAARVHRRRGRAAPSHRGRGRPTRRARPPRP